MNKPASLAELDKLQSIHPFTNLRKHEQKGPVVMTRGRGIYVFDDQGKEYIEGMAGLWCASLGFSDERLIAAATRQLNTLPYYHGFAHKTSDVAVGAAADLLSLAPGRMARVIFGTSGSDANDTAIKLVRYFNNALGRPAKKKIIARTKGYHGVSVAAATLTGLPHLHTGFDLPGPEVVRADCPHHYRFAQVGEGEEAFAARLARQLQALIEKEGADDIAAFIAEPVMGAGGVIPPPAGYFDLIQPMLRHYDILLIADEVICGFGRTGRMWGSQTYDIEPDIVTCAKALTGGYVPFSATMISERVYQPIAEQSAKIGMFGHGYTYSSHPLGAAVAIEAMKVYRETDIAGARAREGAAVPGRTSQAARQPDRWRSTRRGADCGRGTGEGQGHEGVFSGGGSRGAVLRRARACPRARRASAGRGGRTVPAARHHARRDRRDARALHARAARYRELRTAVAVTPIIEFDGVCKTYDGRSNVVDQLDLAIAEGEFLSLLGPSGSGKTTTLMMLAGFERPTAGHIRLKGKSIESLPPYRRNFGMVFQNYALFPHMTVGENLAFPLSVRGIGKERCHPARETRARHGASARTRNAYAGAVIRRATAACGGGTRAGVRAATDPDGRAARRARQAAA